MGATQQKTTLAMWLKRYAVNIPVALLMFAMALASHEGLASPVSTPAALASWFSVSPDYVAWIFVLFGFGAMLAPSRNALFAITSLLLGYAVATFVHGRWLSEPGVVPSGAWVQQIFLFFFAAAWVLWGRPFPDDQLVRGLEKDVRGVAQDLRGGRQDLRGEEQDRRGGDQDTRGSDMDRYGHEARISGGEPSGTDER